MKRFLILFYVLLTVAFPSKTEEAKPSESTQRSTLEIVQLSKNKDRHRMLSRICVEAWYNADGNSIEVAFDGETEGEVFLYLNDNIVGYDSHINTSFELVAPHGSYKIEVITAGWLAYGTFHL